jgi:surface protein
MFQNSSFDADIGSWNLSSVFLMNNIFDNCSLSPNNYSNILNKWAANTRQIEPNVILGAKGCQYLGSAITARNLLTSAPYNWQIIGDTQAPVASIQLQFQNVTGVNIQPPLQGYYSPITVTFSDSTPPVTILKNYPFYPAFQTNTANVTITITGGFTQFGTGNSQSWSGRQCLVAVTNWTGISSFTGAFANTTALTSLPSSLPVQTNGSCIVTDTSYMFYNSRFAFPIGSIENWDTSHIQNMQYMFCGSSIRNTDLTPNKNGNPNIWNTGNVANMDYLFANCTQFQGIGVPLWNTYSVTSIQYAFSGCTNLTSNFLPYPKGDIWNVTGIGNFNGIFQNSSFNADISGWKLTTITQTTSNGNLLHMFDNCYLTSENYSNILQGWSILPEYQVFTISLGAQGCTYLPSAVDARNTLITSRWTIIGDQIINSMTIGMQNVLSNTPIQLPISNFTGTVTVKIYDDSRNLYRTVIITKSYPLCETFTVDIPTIQIVIQGNFQHFGTGNTSSWLGSQFLTSVTGWTGAITSFSGAFVGCYNLKSLLSSLPTYDNGVCTVTDMSYMFYNCKCVFEYLPLRFWDTSQVTNMAYMFSNSSINSLSLEYTGNWNTGNVTNMAYIFAGCTQFLGNGISSWDTHSVTNFQYAFAGCSQLAVDFLPYPNGNIWNTSQVNNFQGMFRSSSFDADISGWNLSSATNMMNMFDYAFLFMVNYTSILNGWSLPNSGSIPQGIMLGAYQVKYDFQNSLNARTILANNGWQFVGDYAYGIILRFDGMTAQQTRIRLPIGNITTPVTVEFSDGSPSIVYTSSMTITPFIVNSTSLTLYIHGGFTKFGDSSGIIKEWPGSKFLTDVQNWGGLTNLSAAFSGCSRLFNFPNYLPFDIYGNSYVTDTSYMFYMQTVPNTLFTGEYILELWDTSQVTNMAYMFFNCQGLGATLDLTPSKKGNPNIWNTGNVTNMSNIFYNCILFQITGVDYWDTHSVTNMNSMFYNCIYVRNNYDNYYKCNFTPGKNGNPNIWNTGSVTDMGSMFYGCPSMAGLGIGYWDTHSVTNMSNMLRDSYYIPSLENWNISNVNNMQGMFDGSRMDVTNYTSTLIGWDTNGNTIPRGIILGATGLQYYFRSQQNERQNLIANYGWSFVGDSPYNGSFTSEMILLFDPQLDLSNTKIKLPVWGLTGPVYAYGNDGNKITIVSDYPQTPIYSLGNSQTIIVIRGNFTGFGTKSNSSWQGNTTLLQVLNWSGITNFSGGFANCTNLIDVPRELYPNTNLTDTSYMFYGASKLTTIGNTFASNRYPIQNMSYMFYQSGLNCLMGLFYFVSLTTPATSMQHMLDFTKMSIDNYSQFLVDEYYQYQILNYLLPRGIVLGAQNLIYDNTVRTPSTGSSPLQISAKDARTILINNYGWSFIGDTLSTTSQIVLQFNNSTLTTFELPIKGIQ